MATNSGGQDVQEMFQRMGEKLGWFKQTGLPVGGQTHITPSSCGKKMSLKSRKKIVNRDEHTNSETGRAKKEPLTESIKSTPASKQTLTSTASAKKTPKVAKSFEGFLSSESDSDKENFQLLNKKHSKPHKHTKPKPPKARLEKTEKMPKAVIQLCSDSEEDVRIARKSPAECVEESIIETSPVLESPDITSASKRVQARDRKGRNSDVYDYTIVKNRESLSSMTLDLDQLGEPLVESTRIHRRSSVTYHQIFDKIDETEISDTSNSKEGNNSSETTLPFCDGVTHRADKDLIGLKKETDLCSTLQDLKVDHMARNKLVNDDLEDIDCNDTKYVTAIEHLDTTSSSSNADLSVNNDDIGSVKKLLKDALRKVNDRELLKKRPKSRKKQKAMVIILSESSDSGEEIVEVIDAVTQTCDQVDEYVTKGKDKKSVNNDLLVEGATCVERLDSKPSVYSDRTIVESGQKDLIVNGKEFMYDQDTHVDGFVESKVMDQENQSVEKSSANMNQSEPFQKHINGGRDVVVSETLNIFQNDVYENTTKIDTENRNHESHMNEKAYIDKTDCMFSTNITDYKYNTKTNIESEAFEMEGDVNKIYRDDTVDDQADEKIGPDSDKTMDNMLDKSEGSEYEVTDVATQTPISSELNVTDVVRNVSDSRKFTLLSSDSDSDDGREDNQRLLKNADNARDKVTCSDEYKIPSVDAISGKCHKAKGCHNMSSNDHSRNISEQESVNDDVDAEDDSETEEESDTNISSKSQSSGMESESSGDGNEVSFAAIAKQRGRNTRNKQEESYCTNADTTQQSWRSERKEVSESSEEDDLDAFFQKLRKPEPKKSDSPKSMTDFIVEDDEMTSESDDDAFYLRETQRLENTPLVNRIKKTMTPYVCDDDEDDVFSSKLYPDSVTKQKRKKKINNVKPMRESWPFSSDSETDTLPDIDCKNPLSPDDNSIGWEKPSKTTSIKSSKTDGKKIKEDQFKEPKTSKGSEDVLFKTPNPINKKKRENSENDMEEKFKTPRAKTLSGYISLSDSRSDDDDDNCGIVEWVTPAIRTGESITSDSSLESSGNNTPVTPAAFVKTRTPLSVKGMQSYLGTPKSASRSFTCTFLKSLSTTTNDDLRDPEAKRYVHGFKKNKEKLSSYLYQLYNRTVFEGKLPADMPLIWNKRLLRTAGYCAYKKNRVNVEDRTARIELSTKVCDSAERVRDTLIHEMCHAAVWLLNGVNGGHGPYWKYWAQQASKIHTELPSISRCHSYSINTKFTYRCTMCGYSIGRHSKSLDTKKLVCGYCKGTFELIVNPAPVTPGSAVGSTNATPRTPRTPNRFALFVKDNYKSIKTKNKDLKHGEVMKELSKLFAANKITS